MAVLVVVASCSGASSSSEQAQPSATTGATASRGTGDPGVGHEARPPAPGVLIDTDLSLWWDDVSALGVANVLHRRGELRLLGVASDVPNAEAVAAIDAVNTWYGNDDVSVAAVAGSGADTFDDGYTGALADRLAHDVSHSDDVEGAVDLHRRVLAGEPDGSVTIVAIGAYTNLAGLLASPPDGFSDLDGRALVAAKVRRLVIMDGLFPDGAPPLTNQEIDPAAAEAVVTGDWPTPIAWIDGFVGVQTTVGGALCTEVAAEHPMRIAYEALFGCEPPGDGNWDAPALLYAIDDLPGAFDEHGHGGAAVIGEAGGLEWSPTSARLGDVYVRVADQTSLNARIDELLVAG